MQEKINSIHYLLVLIAYLFLGMWTLWGSPKPIVDTFDVFSQVGQKLNRFSKPVYCHIYPEPIPKLTIIFIISLSVSLSLRLFLFCFMIQDIQ